MPFNVELEATLLCAYICDIICIGDICSKPCYKKISDSMIINGIRRQYCLRYIV